MKSTNKSSEIPVPCTACHINHEAFNILVEKLDKACVIWDKQNEQSEIRNEFLLAFSMDIINKFNEAIEMLGIIRDLNRNQDSDEPSFSDLVLASEPNKSLLKRIISSISTIFKWVVRLVRPEAKQENKLSSWE